MSNLPHLILMILNVAATMNAVLQLNSYLFYLIVLFSSKMNMHAISQIKLGSI